MWPLEQTDVNEAHVNTCLIPVSSIKLH